MMTEEPSLPMELNGYDSQDERPPERWAPVGASELDMPSCSYDYFGGLSEAERLHHLEEEQEQLNSSLIALTTHFAQVQFRLKQIVDASTEEKEVLLKELEEFAFRGVPDIRDYKSGSELVLQTEQECEEKLAQQRKKQKELIDQLKEQLEDLEKYAYETGEAGMPQSMIMERQSVIIEQLKGKLPLDLEKLDNLSPEELRSHVDKAIRELVYPVKIKEQLVNQLKTQISDLERFIEFVQGETTGERMPRCTCNCPIHGRTISIDTSDIGSGCCSPTQQYRHNLRNQQSFPKDMNNRGVKIIRRALMLLHMFTLAQFGCGDKNFHKNMLKKRQRRKPLGDLRANLEVAITKVADLAAQQEPQNIDSDYTSDSEDTPAIFCNEKLTAAVRKDLACAIRDLLQHGLMPIGQSTSLVPVGCFPIRSGTAVSRMMHLWDLVLKYYELKTVIDSSHAIWNVDKMACNVTLKPTHYNLQLQ
ncbi:RUN domain-containing protein 1-like [Tachypleus tridentatus]|uniref:RUN domain-containing protein 1-like n=1 Tax=Tachypleus tridentatus TaxID=6853 RepID=UPI003FD339F4